MRRRSLASRLALWAAVGALVLRTAMPLLATAAAHARGIAVSEVCEVYGVAPPAVPAPDMAGHTHHHAGHPHHGAESDSDPGCDHCALTALSALATTGDAPQPAASRAAADLPGIEIASGCPLHDACAAWAARLEHGPPARA